MTTSDHASAQNQYAKLAAKTRRAVRVVAATVALHSVYDQLRNASTKSDMR